MKDVTNIVDEVKNVENGVNNLIIPILKDTIQDYKKTFVKMFIIIIALIVSILAIVIYGAYLLNNANQKYIDFLSQYDFSTEQTIFQNTDDNSIINSGITNITQ